MKISVVAAAVLALVTGTDALAESAGRVLAVAGSATIERAGQQRAVQVGALVDSGDTLAVGDKSTLQVRFSDESVVALRSNSQFKIENYKFEKNAESDRSLMSLFKGGMRTITGLIGKTNNKNYGVQTATATIGIRGTHFSVVSCNNDCTRPDGTPEANGTFGSVTDGRITVSNAAGTREFGQQDSFHVPTASSAPVQLLAPPAILSDKDGASRGPSTTAAQAQDGDANSGTGRSSGARVSTSPQLIEQIAPKIGLVGLLTNVSSNNNPNMLLSAASGSGVVASVELQGFSTPLGISQTRLTAEKVAIATPAMQDADLLNAFVFNAQSAAAAVSRFRPVSSSAAAGAYWYYVPPTQIYYLGTHRAFGDAPSSAQPTSGIALYDYVGSTVPADNYGRPGTFSATNAKLVANFGNQTIASQTPVGMSFASNAAMPVTTVYSIPAQTFSMNAGLQSLTGVSCVGCIGVSTGSVNGQFLGIDRQGFAAAIMVRNTQLTTINTGNAGGNVSVFAKQ